MSVGTYALVSLEDTKKALALGDLQYKNDDVIEVLIDGASAIIEAYCSRQLKARTYTEYYDGHGDGLLILKQFPIVSVTSIYDDVNREWSSSTLIDSTDYTIYQDEGYIKLVAATASVLRASSGFTRGHQNIKITYEAGYDSTQAGAISMPADIKLICYEIIMKKLQAFQTKTIGRTSTSVGGQNVTTVLEDLLPDHRLILDTKYRTRNMPI